MKLQFCACNAVVMKYETIELWNFQLKSTLYFEIIKLCF